MNVASAFLLGLLFGIGLIVSGMSDPSKIQGFLDLAGAWDPSLAFVMAGAVGVGLVAFRVAKRRARSFFGGALHLPTARDIDRRLVAGSVVFGIGWGLAGFCPGPALVAFGAGYDKGVVFAIAMVAGMGLFELGEHRARRRSRKHGHPAKA